jgi:hypothetical protein
MQGGPSTDVGPLKTKVGNWRIPPVPGTVDMIGSASRRRTTGICAHRTAGVGVSLPFAITAERALAVFPYRIAA